jgi:uncharacterized repeat protein (TIGR03803 family)
MKKDYAMPVSRHSRVLIGSVGVTLAALVLPQIHSQPANALPRDVRGRPTPAKWAPAQARPNRAACRLRVLFTSFAGGRDGAKPDSRLAWGRGGSLYGATEGLGGGDVSTGGFNFSPGTVFRLSRQGRLTTVHAFSKRNADGYYAADLSGGLVRAPGGDMYGITSGIIGNLAGGAGSVFRLTRRGRVRTIYNFPIGIVPPYTDLVVGPHRALYGTTMHTVFMITTAGHLTTLHVFGPNDGSWPAGPLLRGRGGVLYGTTSQGGPRGGGTVFTIKPSGAFRTVRAIAGSGEPGSGPVGRLVQDSRGNIYGEIRGYVDNTDAQRTEGAVYELTPAGALIRLHAFSSRRILGGFYPAGGLSWGRDGDLYGVTEFGGTENYGTIFRLSRRGGFATLHSFTVGGGGYPLAGLTPGRGGIFYGTASSGATANNGAVFRFTPPRTGCARVLPHTAPRVLPHTVPRVMPRHRGHHRVARTARRQGRRQGLIR